MIEIQKWRAIRDISQQQLADLVGVSRATMSSLESAKVNDIPIETINKIATALEISPIKLCGNNIFKVVPKSDEEIMYVIKMLYNKLEFKNDVMEMIINE